MKYLGCDLQTVVLSVYTLNWGARWRDTVPWPPETDAPDWVGLSAHGALYVSDGGDDSLAIPFRRKVLLSEDLPLWDGLQQKLRPVLSAMIAKQEGPALRSLFGGVLVRNVILADHTLQGLAEGFTLLHPFGVAVDYEHVTNDGAIAQGFMTHLAWDLDPSDPSQVLAGAGGPALTAAEAASHTASAREVMEGISARLGGSLKKQLGIE